MNKIISCLSVMSILLLSCSTFSPRGRDTGKLPKPEPVPGIDIVKKRGGQMDAETISTDQDTFLPPPTGSKPVVQIDLRDTSKLLAFLMISLVIRDLIEIGISIPSIPW